MIAYIIYLSVFCDFADTSDLSQVLNQAENIMFWLSISGIVSVKIPAILTWFCKSGI